MLRASTLDEAVKLAGDDHRQAFQAMLQDGRTVAENEWRGW